MKIQINTDHNIENSERLDSFLQEMVATAFKRYDSHITRVEVHLSDENSGKNGPEDKRCLLEVRTEGKQPHSTTANADTLEKAVNGAITKMKQVLETEIGKTTAHR